MTTSLSAGAAGDASLRHHYLRITCASTASACIAYPPATVSRYC